MSMNDNIVTPFKPRVVPTAASLDGQPNPLVIKMFEDYLKAARAGKLTFAAVATVDTDGVAYSTWEPGGGMTPQVITDALGAVSFLAYRINKACDEGAVPDNKYRD